MTDERPIPTLDVVEIREIPTAALPGVLPIFRLNYRRWSMLIVVHIVDGKLVADCHAFIAHLDASERSTDFAAGSTLGPESLRAFIEDIATRYKISVDEQWAKESAELIESQRVYEARLRAVNARSTFVPQPWHKGSLN